MGATILPPFKDFMDLVEVFIDIFWLTAEGFIPLLVPIVTLILVFKMVSSLLLDRRV